MQFSAVIFDLDGLLLDTERVAIDAGVLALAQMGHAVGPDFLTSLIGFDHDEGLVRLSRHIGVPLDSATLHHAWDAAMEEHDDVPVKPGALQLLDRLQVLRLPFGVATNSRRASAHSKLDRSALVGRITTLTSYEDVARGKPAPDVYLETARKLGCPPERALAFEDSDVGAAAARAAGMTVIQVPDLLAPTGDVPHHVADDLIAGAIWAGLID
ncbi:HAD family hydrolase [Oceaniglobus indicus]|uniref:HAD family hydrolase n=1 Tax=Oceaniglobus indicus TaxID=2047749 RepID=UPI0013045EB8|nr:HAD family phosphatase [Oceaniglobus indicus]